MKIVVPGNHLMVDLLGQRDELLRVIERSFPVDIHVQGNEITISGEAAETDRVGRLFEELVVLLQQGHSFDADSLARTVEMIEHDESPKQVLGAPAFVGRKTVRPRTAGQRRYVEAIRTGVLTFGVGPAGTGKTYLAVAAALQARHDRDVHRIVLSRPAVEAGERLGYLPGDIVAKVDPYLRPLYDALYDMLDPEEAQRLLDRGTIEVAPLAYMRGRTLNDSFVILDEAQNATGEQMKMLLTRLGFGSRAVVTGDVTQIDIPDARARSGLLQVGDILQGIEGITFVQLSSRDVVRHRIVQEIVDAYDRHEVRRDTPRRGGRR